MRNKINIPLLLLLAFVFVSCEDELEFDNVNFTVDNAEVSVGETVNFTITGNADTYVIYTGDEDHEFENSYMVVTSGQELDQELVFVTADSIPQIEEYLTPIVDNYNADVGQNQQLDIDEIMLDISSQVGIEYTNKLTAAYIIWEFMDALPGQVARDIVDLFYEDESVLLAPTEGFSTGFAVDRIEKTFEYVYETPGMYSVTLIATKISGKQYPENDYNTNQLIRELFITVVEP